LLKQKQAAEEAAKKSEEEKQKLIDELEKPGRRKKQRIKTKNSAASPTRSASAMKTIGCSNRPIAKSGNCNRKLKKRNAFRAGIRLKRDQEAEARQSRRAERRESGATPDNRHTARTSLSAEDNAVAPVVPVHKHNSADRPVKTIRRTRRRDRPPGFPRVGASVCQSLRILTAASCSSSGKQIKGNPVEIAGPKRRAVQDGKWISQTISSPAIPALMNSKSRSKMTKASNEKAVSDRSAPADNFEVESALFFALSKK